MPAATASPWAALLPTALAGTRRQPLAPLPGLTPSLGSETDAPEKTLLLTAANLRLVERAGRQPVPDDGALAFAPAAETLPEMGPAAAALLARLLRTEGDWQFVKLRHFLRLLRQHQQRIPYRLLRPLADVLLEPNHMFLFRMLREGMGGLGSRGRALLALGKKPLDEWSRQLGAGWTPGVPAHEQPGALGELARQGPRGQTLAMTGLFKTLINWKDWQEYEAVWWVLRQWTTDGPLPPEAGPLLDQLVQQPKWTPGGRGHHLVYHPDLAGLRAAMPDSDLAERCWQLTQPYFTLDPTAEHSPRLRLGLLPAWSDADQYPGFSETDRHYHSARELGEWLALVPPSRWTTAWYLTAEQAVAAAAAAGRAAVVVLSAWKRAAAVYGESDFLAALADYYRHRLQDMLSGGSGLLPECTPLRDADVLSWLQHLAPELPLPPDLSLSEPWRENWRLMMHNAAGRYSPALLRGLLPLLAASQQPSPHPGSEALARLLSHNLHAYAHCPDLTILPELQAAFAFEVPPSLASELAGVVRVLQLARDFEAALLTPAGR